MFSWELVGSGKQGRLGSLLWKPWYLGVLLLCQRPWQGTGSGSCSPGGFHSSRGCRWGSGAPCGPSHASNHSRAGSPSSLAEHHGLLLTLAGSMWPRGSDSSSPKKEQKEYLITGGCCQLAVSEVLGVLGGPSCPSPALAQDSAATSSEGVCRTGLSDVPPPSPGVWSLLQSGEPWVPF